MPKQKVGVKARQAPANLPKAVGHLTVINKQFGFCIVNLKPGMKLRMGDFLATGAGEEPLLVVEHVKGHPLVAGFALGAGPKKLKLGQQFLHIK